MTRKTLDRATLLDAMLPHVLEHGIDGLSLRPLARSAGTSDRMLLYHFESKELLETALLQRIADMAVARLDAAFADQRAASAGDCLLRFAAILRDPAARPLLRVWAGVLTGAVAGRASHRRAAERIVARQIEWLADHLPPSAAAGTAERILLIVEGAVVLDMLGQDDLASATLERFARDLG